MVMGEGGELCLGVEYKNLGFILQSGIEFHSHGLCFILPPQNGGMSCILSYFCWEPVYICTSLFTLYFFDGRLDLFQTALAFILVRLSLCACGIISEEQIAWISVLGIKGHVLQKIYKLIYSLTLCKSACFWIGKSKETD